MISNGIAYGDSGIFVFKLYMIKYIQMFWWFIAIGDHNSNKGNVLNFSEVFKVLNVENQHMINWVCILGSLEEYLRAL